MEIDPEKLKAISDARLASVQAAIDGFVEGVNRVADGLQERMTDLLASGEVSASAPQIKELQYIQQELMSQLNTLGYASEVKQFLDKFDVQQTYAVATGKAMGLPPGRLSRINSRALSTLRATNYAYLASLGPATVQAIAQGVVQNAIAGTSRARMIEATRRTLTGKFKNYAATYADTALTSYDRRVALEVWQEAGLEKFLYRGPRDIKNRPFCEKHVGKVYTVDEIKQLQNGMQPPMDNVLLYGGGWNCRHVWTPALATKGAIKPPASVIEMTPQTRGRALLNWIKKLIADKEGSLKLDAFKISSSLEEHDAGVKLLVSKATNPSQLIITAKDAAGKPTFQVAGDTKLYASKGAAWNKAKLLFEQVHPEKAANIAALKTAVATLPTAEALAAQAKLEVALGAFAQEAGEYTIPLAKAAIAKREADLALKAAVQAHSTAQATLKAAEKLSFQAMEDIIAQAKTPSGLILKGVDAATGKPTFQVVGDEKVYASSGAAWNKAKALFEKVYPDQAAAQAAKKATKAATVAPIPVPTNTPAAAPPAAPAAPVAQQTGHNAFIGPRNARVVERAAAARNQGMSLVIDAGQVEDQAALLTEERLAAGGSRTVIRFKVRPEAQQALLETLGAPAEAVPEAPGVRPKGYKLKAGDPDAPPLPAVGTLPSMNEFGKLLSGAIDEAGIAAKNGYGTPITAEGKQQLVDAVKKYKVDLAAAQTKLDAEIAARTPSAKPAAGEKGFTVRLNQHILADSKRLLPDGTIQVMLEDQPFSAAIQIQSHGAVPRQYAIEFPDGVKARYTPFTAGNITDTRRTLYAHQGTMELFVKGAVSNDTVTSALARLEQLGVAAREATAADEELMYLGKASYAAKVHKSAQWLATERLPAAEQLAAKRNFWSKRLGVDDVTKLPHYDPKGEYSQAGIGEGKAGARVQYRFDFSAEDMSRLAEYRITQSPAYGHDTVAGFLGRTMNTNRALMSTTERLRTGILNKADHASVNVGASKETDMASGGASYVFARLKSKSSDSYGFYWRAEKLARRLDAIHYSGDQFGAVVGGIVERERATTAKEMISFAGSGNEINFKAWLPLFDGLDKIVVNTNTERAQVLEILKKAGVQKVEGKSVEDLVKVVK